MGSLADPTRIPTPTPTNGRPYWRRASPLFGEMRDGTADQGRDGRAKPHIVPGVCRPNGAIVIFMHVLMRFRLTFMLPQCDFTLSPPSKRQVFFPVFPHPNASVLAHSPHPLVAAPVPFDTNSWHTRRSPRAHALATCWAFLDLRTALNRSR